MNIQYKKVGSLSYGLIDQFYTACEVNLIERELRDIFRFRLIPEKTNSSRDSNGNSRKKGTGVFLDNLYNQNRHQSDILTLNRKLFNPLISNELCKYDVFFGHLINCNKDTTLVNYYANEDYYHPHTDYSSLTAVTFFSFGEFSGGQFCFSDYEVELESISNRTVIFPGCVRHGAKPIITKENNYRITIANFINYKE